MGSTKATNCLLLVIAVLLTGHHLNTVIPRAEAQTSKPPSSRVQLVGCYDRHMTGKCDDFKLVLVDDKGRLRTVAEK